MANFDAQMNATAHFAHELEKSAIAAYWLSDHSQSGRDFHVNRIHQFLDSLCKELGYEAPVKKAAAGSEAA